MKIVSILTLTFSFYSLIAQQTAGGIAGKGLDLNPRPHGTVKEIKRDEPETKGDYYLNKNWLVGSIVMFSGRVINDVPIKYEMEKDHLEIMTSNNIKVIPGHSVIEFNLFNEYFNRIESYKNGKNFQLDEIPLVGFLRVIEKGKWSLYSQTKAVYVTGNYIPTLDMGERDNRITKQTKYYFGNGKVLTEVSKKRKKLLGQFEDSSLQTHIKNNKINWRKETGLIEVIKFLNTKN